MRATFRSKLLATARGLPCRWRADERGNVIIYVSIAMASILGIVGLALDASRAQITHSESQAAADAAALAAASAMGQAQLQGLNAAGVQSAVNAALGSLTNSESFASTAGAVSIQSVTYLSGLPAQDKDPIGNSYVTTADKAAYVKVQTVQLTHQNTFLKVVSDGSDLQIATTAVAGFRQVFCKIPPLMMCNPNESSGALPPIGSEIRLVTPPGNTLVSGNFNVLVPPECPNGNANCLRDAISKVSPNVCISGSVTPDSGLQAGPLSDAMNVRFARYPNGSTIPKNSTTSPDTNVTVRFADNGNQCTSLTTQAGSANFPDDSPQPAVGSYGGGVWNCASYWSTNHPGVTAPAGCTSATSSISRYGVYEYERQHGIARTPACNTPGIDERRVLYMAVVNCNANSTRTGQPTTAKYFVKGLLIKPVQGSPLELDMEVIGIVTTGQDNQVVKNEVQLYR